ncbi:MAG: flavodoxin family protein [Candidatus Fimenecus sp.]
MNILEIMGSPRKNGNTAKILNEISLLDKEDKVEIIDLTDYHIGYCLGCSACQRDTKHFRCVQNDDANILLEKIIRSDVILYGTPLYGHNFSALMKNLLDRHLPLFKFVDGKDKSVNEMEILSAVKEKPVGLIVSCQGPEENNAELIKMLFDKFCESSLTRCFGKYVFPFCDPETARSGYSRQILSQLINDIQAL